MPFGFGNLFKRSSKNTSGATESKAPTSGSSSSKNDKVSNGPVRSDFSIMLDDGLGQFIVPIIGMLAHIYFLYTGYVSMVNVPNPLKNGLPGYQPIVFVGGYLIVVYYMYKSSSSRKPIEPKAAMFIYNLYETLLSFSKYYTI